MFVKISINRFRQLCLTTLFFALFIIIWGAWVRFSHSGDGCGDHWPLCNDQFIPKNGEGKTWIEWFHRASSSMFGLVVLALSFYSFQCFPKKHKVRFWGSLSLIFTISEALIGAVLVLKGLTGQNDSLMRILILNLHLINSLFLTGSILMCWRHSFKQVEIPFKKISIFAIMFLFIALTGSVASLSNTLYPSSSLIQGILMDLNKNSPLILQLRILHPLIAICITSCILYFFIYKIYSKKIRPISYTLIVFLVLGILTGTITLLSLSPVFMKLLHLLVAHTIWLCILLL